MQIAAILGLAVGVSYAFSHFFVRLGLDNSTPTSGVVINVAVNAIGLWGLTLLFSPLFPLASTSIWPFILSGLFAPTLAMEFHFRGIAHIGLARSFALLGTTPLFAVVLAVLFLGERPPAIMAAGGVSIAAGVILSELRQGTGEKIRGGPSFCPWRRGCVSRYATSSTGWAFRAFPILWPARP